MTRVAEYATPGRDNELARLAAVRLERDAFTGLPRRAPDLAPHPLVAEPARYGCHAPLWAPVRPRLDEPGARFVVHSFHPLGPPASPKPT